MCSYRTTAAIIAAVAIAAAAASHVELPLTCDHLCQNVALLKNCLPSLLRKLANTGDRHVLVYNSARQAFVKNYE